MPSNHIKLAKLPRPPAPFVWFDGHLLGCGHCVRVLSCSDITLYNNGAIIEKPVLFDEPDEVFAYLDANPPKWYGNLKKVGNDGRAKFYEADNGIAIFAAKDGSNTGIIDVYPSWNDLVNSVSTIGTQWEDLKNHRVGKWVNIKKKGMVYHPANRCEENGDDIMRALFD